MITSVLDAKDFNDWRNDTTKKEGATRLNLEFLREIKQLEHELAGIGVILFFLVTRCDMWVMERMLRSAGKQRRLMGATAYDLKKYALDKKWEKVFKANCTRIRNRVDYMYRIIEENVRLTEYYPWYMAVGKERVQDFQHKYRGGEKESSDQLLEEIQDWNAEHEDEVKAYVESIAEEKEAYEDLKQKRADERKARKEALRMIRKHETAEVREIKENKHKHEVEERRKNREWGLQETWRERAERERRREENKKALTARAARK